MVTINLLPVKAELRKKALLEHLTVLAAALIVLTVILAGIQTAVVNTRDDLNDEIASTKVEINKLSKEAKEIEEFKKRKQELERKLDIIANLNTQKTGPVEVLDQLSLIMPEKVWLRSLNNSSNDLVLEGFAVDNPTIALLMKKLQASPYFTDVELILSQQEGANHKFTIKCKTKLPA